MSKYYRVKPEFDNFRIIYSVKDYRKKYGTRNECITLLGHELISARKFNQIISEIPRTCDIFEEVNIDTYNTYNCFGAKYSVDCEYDSKLFDEKIRERHLKIQKLKELYSVYCFRFKKCVTPRYALDTMNDLSIDSLDSCIEYYENILNSKN